MEVLATEFNALMLETYEQAREQRYFANHFIQMLDQYGGVETAKRLLANPNAQEGLTRLWELGRLDISVEALVIRPRFSSLFTSDEIATARSRLERLGYFKPSR